MKWKPSLRIHNFFTRLRHWEYWGMHWVYAPVYPVYLWYCVRSGFRFFFSAANPRIQNGGMVMESKYDIYRQLPAATYPPTLFFETPAQPQEVLRQVTDAGFRYPLIVKPDIGMRGLAVRKVKNRNELLQVAAIYNVNFLVQEFVPYENELGIFWCRYPNRPEGFISGIVGKEPLTITGDGVHTMYQLLLKNSRYRLQLTALEQQYGKNLQQVLPAGEATVLVPYGNHARGAKFVDASELATPQLTRFLNRLCHQVPDFYFGRLDIRFESIELLEQGKGFSIIELNGAGSEPTHIYDPRHSIFFAWKEIIRHWKLQRTISRINHRNGAPYLSWKAGAALFRDNSRYTSKLEALHQLLLQVLPVNDQATAAQSLFTAA
jgi:hypothetical protein